ncbi:MAG TPA: amidoligase family protein [Kofleriaceae bacterium]|nr:amidoligase family protein [Kofleriaceae bacterium]
MRYDAAGRTRTVGVEIELTDLDVPRIAATVADTLGGAPRRENDYLAYVDVPGVGEFRVEADLGLLQEAGRRRAGRGDPGLVDLALDLIASVAELIAPFEVSSPPLPYTQLPIMDRLSEALRRNGGTGTKRGPLMALGLHLNPLAPDFSAASIHAFLRAFAVLDPWLRAVRGVDLSRRATPFVDAYPEPYVRYLLDSEQPGSLVELIDAYLTHNPTRNRALDLLPLLAHLDPERIAARIDDVRVTARPTYHYRLPDCRLGETGWHVSDEWRFWLIVERAAADETLLSELVEHYREVLDDHAWTPLTTRWPPRCTGILAQRGSISPRLVAG